jgi:hypothetical protein
MPLHRRLVMSTPDVSPSDRDPRVHTQNMQRRLRDEIDHLRADIDKVDEPQLKAMFETAAEVLNGLVKAFADYERKNERAWRAH